MASPEAVLSFEEIRQVEVAYADASPSLMERAGAAAARQAMQLLAGKKGCVLVLVGPGNNGGDGYVVARILLEQGVQVLVVSCDDASRLPKDAQLARERWLEAGGQSVDDFVGGSWALVVDALFGIGLKRPIDGRYAEWIGKVNALSVPVLALDIPSGLESESGKAAGAVVRASHTACFIALKPGLLTLDGPDHCGEICVHSLDIEPPASIGERIGRVHFERLLKPRLHNVHKGSFGTLGVIGGASGMVGAALLSGHAALKLGAGKVQLGLLDVAAPGVDACHPELMLKPVGEVHLQADVLAIGPGLGAGEAAALHLRRAIGFEGVLIIDADGLNLLAQSPALIEALAQRENATILTPHPAEAGRLMWLSVAEIQADRIGAAVAMASRFNSIVILKGCGSVVANPDGRWYINTTGHSGMASAGMGDVLTGVLGALVAQHWPAKEAALAAVHLHGAAAELLRDGGVGPVGMLASETIDACRRVFNDWLASKH